MIVTWNQRKKERTVWKVIKLVNIDHSGSLFLLSLFPCAGAVLPVGSTAPWWVGGMQSLKSALFLEKAVNEGKN